MLKISLYFILSETCALIAFLLASSHQDWSSFRFIPALLVLIFVGYVSIWKANVFSYRENLYISIIISSALVSIVNLLGFTVYSGLAKDLNFLSSENAIRTAFLLIISFIGHYLLLSLSHIINRYIDI